MDRKTVKEYIIGLMAPGMQETGSKTRCTGSENSYGQTAENTKAPSQKA